MPGQRTHLVIIDPQNDFCDLPPAYTPEIPGGSGARYAPALPVPGAHADLCRVAGLIDRAGKRLTGISITLDSHQHLDIAHPTFWRQGNGQPVSPFTPIRAEDLAADRYVPRDPEAKARTLAYLESLEAAGRYTHMVWPVHCEIGTWGHNIHHDLRVACNRWEEANMKIVNKVVKGTNPWTEHYSAIRAEVPDPDDPDTDTNTGFIALLREADRILIAGEAGSHCVKATVEHIVEHLAPQALSRLVLLVDCMSPVSGFEAQYTAFLREMGERGLQISTAEEALSGLLSDATERGVSA